MKRRTLLAVGFGIALLPACTAVLGMDRAELDGGLGGPRSHGGGPGAAGLGGQRLRGEECSEGLAGSWIA